jgi:hypothetical protein
MPRTRDKMDRRGAVPRDSSREVLEESDVKLPDPGESSIDSREVSLGTLADPVRWDEV